MASFPTYFLACKTYVGTITIKNVPYRSYLKDKSTEDYFDIKEQFEMTVSYVAYESRLIVFCNPWPHVLGTSFTFAHVVLILALGAKQDRLSGLF